jgi:acetyl-CoA/propionyl-CoA carboxylase biotin carboxyl carrier protein
MWLPALGATTRATRFRPGAHSGVTALVDGTVTVPMQGTIVEVRVAEGDTIVEGDVLCVLEAMKMENPIRSPGSGTLVELRVQVGDSLGAGDIVARIE